MNKSTFGSCLKELRTEKGMSQAALAEMVGRKKMTISQIESDKNAPPQGKLLNDILGALNLSEAEEGYLRFLAAETRNSIPSDIQDYFFKNPAVCSAIRAAQRANMSNSDWDIVKKSFESETKS